MRLNRDRLTPDRALDVGMRQGRNALFLARRRWRVTGFDVSQAGVSQALERARAAELEIEAHVQGFADFDCGLFETRLVRLHARKR